MVDGIVGVGGEIECRNLLWESGGLWLDVLFLIVVLLYVGGEVVGIYGGGGWLLEDFFWVGVWCFLWGVLSKIWVLWFGVGDCRGFMKKTGMSNVSTP